MTTARRVRIVNAQLQGEILLAGQRVQFEANIEGANIDATFDQLPPGITDWDAFQVLERFIAHYLRGGYGDPTAGQ